MLPEDWVPSMSERIDGDLASWRCPWTRAWRMIIKGRERGR
jgi:hypothetical protein